jgi:DNA-binding transcriptional regulator GbsR (MarR family)
MNATDALVEELGRFFEDAGSTAPLGKIFAALFTADQPVTIGQICGRLGLSKASVSINIRLLKDLGFCRKLATGADRQHYYELERSYLSKSYELRVARQTRQLMELSQAAAELGKGSGFINDRIKELLDFQNHMIASQNQGLATWKKKKTRRGDNRDKK